jgi:hypothetical protein
MDRARRRPYPWPEIRCSRYQTLRDVDLAALLHKPTTFVHDMRAEALLERGLIERHVRQSHFQDGLPPSEMVSYSVP